jgi:DNA-binding transcriptional MerR regulator
MAGLRVSELADRAGVSASTVRFYERIGLLSPARRAVNGYRLFDDSALDELALVQRAKGIGMTLDDIAALVETWPKGECRILQARLRAYLAGQIDKVRGQRRELGEFERQLQVVLGRLTARDPGPELCGRDCGCEADLDTGAEDTSWRCSLSPDALEHRLAEWRSWADAATSIERNEATVRLTFEADPDSVGAVARLCAAEASCCPSVRFALDISEVGLVVTASSPGDPGLVEVLFPGAGSPG